MRIHRLPNGGDAYVEFAYVSDAARAMDRNKAYLQQVMNIHRSHHMNIHRSHHANIHRSHHANIYICNDCSVLLIIFHILTALY